MKLIFKFASLLAVVMVVCGCFISVPVRYPEPVDAPMGVMNFSPIKPSDTFKQIRDKVNNGFAEITPTFNSAVTNITVSGGLITESRTGKNVALGLLAAAINAIETDQVWGAVSNVVRTQAANGQAAYTWITTYSNGLIYTLSRTNVWDTALHTNDTYNTITLAPGGAAGMFLQQTAGGTNMWSNDANTFTNYNEIDTLQSVANRGSTITNDVLISGDLTLSSATGLYLSYTGTGVLRGRDGVGNTLRLSQDDGTSQHYIDIGRNLSSFGGGTGILVNAAWDSPVMVIASSIIFGDGTTTNWLLSSTGNIDGLGHTWSNFLIGADVVAAANFNMDAYSITNINSLSSTGTTTLAGLMHYIDGQIEVGGGTYPGIYGADNIKITTRTNGAATGGGLISIGPGKKNALGTQPPGFTQGPTFAIYSTNYSTGATHKDRGDIKFVPGTTNYNTSIEFVNMSGDPLFFYKFADGRLGLGPDFSGGGPTIPTNLPQAQLDVNGTVLIRDTLTVSNNLTLNGDISFLVSNYFNIGSAAMPASNVYAKNFVAIGSGFYIGTNQFIASSNGTAVLSGIGVRDYWDYCGPVTQSVYNLQYFGYRTFPRTLLSFYGRTHAGTVTVDIISMATNWSIGTHVTNGTFILTTNGSYTATWLSNNVPATYVAGYQYRERGPTCSNILWTIERKDIGR